jgi:secondary thiamine-phosphate synthase enzyme
MPCDEESHGIFVADQPGRTWLFYLLFPTSPHMAAHADQFSIPTRGKGTYEITERCQEIVRVSGIRTGTVTVFVQHTSASLVIYENADPSARTDLHSFFDHLVPEDTPYFVHTYEGPDDMPSHLRMALTRTSEVIPVVNGRLALGTWQGIFLFEHRRAPQTRSIVVSVVGD